MNAGSCVKIANGFGKLKQYKRHSRHMLMLMPQGLYGSFADMQRTLQSTNAILSLIMHTQSLQLLLGPRLCKLRVIVEGLPSRQEYTAPTQPAVHLGCLAWSRHAPGATSQAGAAHQTALKPSLPRASALHVSHAQNCFQGDHMGIL